MKQQKRGVKTAAFGTHAGPSHVLFSAFFAGSSPATVTSAASSNSSSGALARTRENRQRCLRIDPRLERDYIYKRKRRAHQSADWSSSAPSASSRTTTTTIGTCSWEGVAKVEKDLVECCESLQDDFYSPDNDEETDDDGDDDEVDTTGGVLLSSNLLSSSPLGFLSLSSPTNSIAGVLAIEKGTNVDRLVIDSCYPIPVGLLFWHSGFCVANMLLLSFPFCRNSICGYFIQGLPHHGVEKFGTCHIGANARGVPGGRSDKGSLASTIKGKGPGDNR